MPVQLRSRTRLARMVSAPVSTTRAGSSSSRPATSTSRSAATAVTASDEAPIAPVVDTARSKLCSSCSRVEARRVSTSPNARSDTPTIPSDHASNADQHRAFECPEAPDANGNSQAREGQREHKADRRRSPERHRDRRSAQGEPQPARHRRLTRRQDERRQRYKHHQWCASPEPAPRPPRTAHYWLRRRSAMRELRDIRRGPW